LAKEKQKKEKKIRKKKPKTERVVPRWAVISLSVAWGLLAALAIGVGIWQWQKNAPAPEEETGERSRTFLYGETVDTSADPYTYDTMAADLEALAKEYPHLLRVASAGQSADGREILYADVGSADATRQIFVSAGIHGREHMTPMLAMKLLESYLINYNVEDETGTALADLSTDVMLRVVPMVNPDGIAIAQGGIDAIRSEELRATVQSIYETDTGEYQSYRDNYPTREDYLKHWKANARGVDLNRNFPIEYWQTMSTGIPHPSSQKYKGPSAGSEPETQAMMRLMEELKHLEAVVSLHSQGEILYWDCGQTGELRRENGALVEKLAAMTGYRPVDTFTHPDATLDDWAALELGIPSVNVEVGKGNVVLPHDQFEGIWNRTKELWRVLLTEKE
jgi:g-D-glutamyl-meso-diaminopimelate peptidase